MTTDWSNCPKDADLYLRPVAPAAHPEGARPLTGGPLYWQVADLIAVHGGERVLQERAGLQRLDNIIGTLPDDLRGRLSDLAVRLTEARPPIVIGENHVIEPGKPTIMGVLNVTPDSFSDGGRHADHAAAIEHGRALIAAGCDIVDIGGESTRPGASPVWEEEERQRVLPVIEALRGGGALISVDTRKPAIMREAVAAGASMINDVTALTYENESVTTAASLGVPVILMHSQGDPATMQEEPRYGDVLLDIYDYLAARVQACEAAGIDRSRIIVDPGIGFGKTVRHNLDLINGLALFHGLGCPVMLGASRKRFIGALSGEEAADRRMPGSLAAAIAGLGQGAHFLRVHDVAETRQALAVWRGLCDAAHLSDAELGL